MSTSEDRETLQKIDIMELLHLIWTSVKKVWYVFLILPLLLGGLNYFWVSSRYDPTYTAEATVSVSMTGLNGDSTNNARTAAQLGKVFPYILTSSALKDIIANDLGRSGIPETISVSNIENTNFLTIRVTGWDPEATYNVLQSVIKNYPQVAQHVVGRTTVQIIDDGGIPTDTTRSSTMRNALMNGAMAGLVIAGIFLLVYIITFRTVLTSRDLRSITNVSYLGTLPVYRKKKRRKSEQKGINILKKNIQSDYLEAVRVIRTRLDRKMDKGKKVVMVTSSLPGEGKSTVSVNLALSFAMQKKKVVLIDCDLRNPSVKEVLNLSTKEPGLKNYLMGKCKLQDTLISYESKGLKLIVLPGSNPDNDEHTELLRSEQMKKLVEMVRDIADVVILDTPPSAMLADAEMAVPYADLAVYVVLCDYARTTYIQKGIRELSETGVEIAGIVLNAGKESSSSGYSSYGSKSYYA